uniref:Uncharacterized protein n=1 Tax=Triticum urartu TaxID=4572 RepID=A0A8R7QMP1_TRIUA
MSRAGADGRERHWLHNSPPPQLLPSGAKFTNHTAQNSEIHSIHALQRMIHHYIE